MLASLKSFVFSHPRLERLSRLLLDRRYQLARRHLRGVGLEIGALDRPLFLPRLARAYYLDRLLPAKLREHYPELSHRHIHVSMVGDGESLDCIANDSLDFLVANHMIEHCQDPVGAFHTFVARLKTRGRIFMAVPDKRRTFDHDRDATTLEHLIADHRQGAGGSRAGHYLEWATRVEHLAGSAATVRAQELLARDYSIHFHCWTRPGFSAFLDYLADSLPLRIVDVKSWRNENIFIIEKTSR